MKTLNYKVLNIVPLLLVAFIFHSGKILAQEDPNQIDLAVEIVNAPTTVKINEGFGITARVFLEANSSSIPAGENIEVTLKLFNQSGHLVGDPFETTFSGFAVGESVTLDDPKPAKPLVFFQIPWSEAINWKPEVRWKLVLHAATSSVESTLDNNKDVRDIAVTLPDLSTSITSVTARDPITGNETSNFIPNTNYIVRGKITNIGLAPTQQNIFLPLRAQLRKMNPVGSQYELGSIIDTQEILVPPVDIFDADGTYIDFLRPSAEWDFEVDQLFLPPDAEGQYAVTVEVNPENLPGGPIMMEEDFVNNFAINPSAGDGDTIYFDPPFISITPDTSDDGNLAMLEYVPGSYAGERGIFRGLEPAFLSFAIRNGGSRPVASGDTILAKVVLSKDLEIDNTDFVLREFNLGGDGIGLGMLAGETVNLTWFQQMPDNFEGDYYLLININNNGVSKTDTIDTSPMITLASQGSGTTSFLNTSLTGTDRPAERPDTSGNGRYVTYEKTQLVNGQELQQIYIIDMEQPVPTPKLISRTYTSSAAFPLPANGNSFRPKISADGSTVVFHSSASNLVPGDSNNKEDVFLYRLSTETMFRAVITLANSSDTEELNGRSLYPDVNGDGSKIVFESDATNSQLLSSGRQIFLWTLDPNGDGYIEVISKNGNGKIGNGNSYNPSIDNEGRYVVFDSFASNIEDNTSDTNSLRDIFLKDLLTGQPYLANLNFLNQQTVGGESLNPKISGDGTRIVFESKALNLVRGAGIAKVEIVEGGYGYKGRPSVRIFDDSFNSGGSFGTGAILALKEDGINLLEELKADSIQIINSGTGYITPRIEIIHDPAYPAPLQEAKAVAYLSNPDGDIYYVDVQDVLNDVNGSKRISESSSSTGGNFGSRSASISDDGRSIVYSTKSSNLLQEEIVRDDGKVFYNSNYVLPKAKVVLVGGIGEIEIKESGSGYTQGNLLIVDQSGTGSGAIASYQVDNRGRITTINIIDSGSNYNLETTKISVPEPRGGTGFEAGEIRFTPTLGLGVNRVGGGRIYKVEMLDNGNGYRIGEETDVFTDIIKFEGDGADLNEDGFPDGRIRPERIQNINGGLYLEQRFDIDVLSNDASLLNTSITFYDKNNSVAPIVVQFIDGSSNGMSIGISGKSKNEIREELISLLKVNLSIPEANKNADHDTSASANIQAGPVLYYQSGTSSFRLSALSGRVISSNTEAVGVVSESNMLIMGSGYTVATPVVNQIPLIYGYSEALTNASYVASEGLGRMASLSEQDNLSDDIYLFKFDENNNTSNTRISTSSFGTPVGYLPDEGGLSFAPSNHFPSISGDGRYVFFSSDAWGNAGIAFARSNQLPLDTSSNRDIYLRDLKTNTISVPNSKLDLLYPRSGVEAFAPNSSIPVIADLNHTGTVSRVSMILNQANRGSMTLFRGGGNFSNYNSGRYTSMIPNLESGEYSLQLVAYGPSNQVVATSSLIRFKVKNFEGSLPPNAQLNYPRSLTAITSTSVVPIGVSANDSDGVVERVNYYIDGVLERTIERVKGFSEIDQTYSYLIDLKSILNQGENQGVRSIFAIAEDNSGNFVSTDIQNFSFTKGANQMASISINSGALGFDVSSAGLDVNITNGKVSSVTLLDGAIGKDLFSARVELLNDGNGSGAIVEPILQTDPSLPNYGNIIDINVTSGGSNYDSSEKFLLKVIPILRVINEGIPAQMVVTTSPPTDANATTFSASGMLGEYVDGSLKNGYGYVVSPRMRLFGWSFVGLGRIPLIQTNNPTSSLENFNVSQDIQIGSTARSGLFGGFTQSIVNISVEANASDEVIESVSLVINGEISDDYTLSKPTIGNLYNFAWMVDDPGEYAIYALVKDNAGNVSSTPENLVSVQNYEGSGISVSFTGEDNYYEVESNGQLLLVAEATSEYGISEVEFFIDDISVGKVFPSGGSSFQNNVNLADYNFRQGEHEVSLVARDRLGNIAGTFSREYTNLESRLNRTLLLLPPIIKNVPSIEIIAPESNLTIPLNSSIRLLANASDIDGGLKGVQFYVNEENIYAWNGSLEINSNSLPSDKSIIRIDDGTGRGAIGFEFDNDGLAADGNITEAMPSVGNNKKLTLSGNFNFTKMVSYVVEIDGVSDSGDSYKLSLDGGITFIDEKKQIDSTSPQLLAHGISATFEEDTDHRVGDRWTFIGQPKNQIITIFDSDKTFINVLRTKLNLYNSIRNLNALGKLSIDARVNDHDNFIYLNHTHDRAVLSEASVIVDFDTFITSEKSDEGMILSTAADSTFAQPFGTTWEPNAIGNYLFTAVAEDFSGNRVSSEAVLVSILEPRGVLPEIELEEISTHITFNGSPIEQNVLATASDPDGFIAAVTFYNNGVLIGTDDTRPYSTSLEINATGHYEVYAVARDNSGNLVTSNVQRIIVNRFEETEQNLVVQDSTAFVNGTISVSSTYFSPKEEYDPNISALVFINGQYEGNATKLPRTPPQLGQQDPGQSFIFEKEARGVGNYEVEFLILNGNETSSATAQITISESPLTDDYLFLKSLWNGLYDRDPLSPEINPFLSGLRNGSLSREQVVEKLQYSEEFKTARDLLLVGKTLHGTWRSVPASLEATNQAGYGSRSGGGGNSAAARAAMGMPYTPADGNESDLGFYEGVEDDHSDMVDFATRTLMNDLSFNAILSRPGDLDVFKIKSKNLPNEGLLEIKILRTPFGIRVPAALHNPITIDWSGNRYNIIVQFKDGSFVEHSPEMLASQWPAGDGISGSYIYDLSSFQNVDSYIFGVKHFEVNEGTLGVVSISTFNSNYLDQDNFLSEEEVAQLEIESRINDFDPIQAVTYQTNSFSYTNRYGQIETHDPSSFFNRLFRNKYEQDPNPTQSARGVNLLKDGRTQLQFLQDFALENNVVTVGGYNYTTSEAQLAIPNVPLDAAAFAETALVYSALMGEAPSNDQVALLTMTPRMEVRPLSQRAELILDMPEYAKQYGVAKPEIEFIGIQNGQTFSGGEQISVEASSLGMDNLGGTIDDGKIYKTELFLNGKSIGLMSEPSIGEFFYTLSLDSNLTAGEYSLEAVAEDLNGMQSRTKRMIRVASDKNLTLEITAPGHGAVLEVGDELDVLFSTALEVGGSIDNNFSNSGISQTFLEINGKIQWSAVLSLDHFDSLSDEQNFSIDDGTGRGPVVFEFDNDGLASGNGKVTSPKRMVNNSGRTSTDLSLGDNIEYKNTESREYLIEIDGVEDGGRTYRWSIDGGTHFNRIEQKAETPTISQVHELSYDIRVKFDAGNEAYSLGDKWSIQASPMNEIIEIGKQGSVNDKLENTRLNLIKAINRARNEGKLAIYAENPFSNGVYKGSLPEQYILPNSIILHHDASYPIVESVKVTIPNEVQKSVTSLPCMDIISSNSTSLPLFLGGCLEMQKPFVSLRVVGMDSMGNRYYSGEKVFSVRNTNEPYAKLLKVGDFFNPGRLSTIQVSEVNSGGGIVATKILDSGSGYKHQIAEKYNYEFNVFSTTGTGARPRPEVNAASGLVDDINFSYTYDDGGPITTINYPGSNYKVGDIILTSPPAVFEMGEPINLYARLIGSKSQVERVAFYANGVEIEGNFSEMLGGYYSMVFNPPDPGDYFITVRKLYGDLRDSHSFVSSSLGHMSSNISFLNNSHYGWEKMWSQQSTYAGSTYSPVWLWQHKDYWNSDVSWQIRTHWDGAAPIRVVEPEENDVVITLNTSSHALRVDKLLDSQLTRLKANVQRSSRNAPKLVKAFLYGNESLLAEAEIDANESIKTSSTISFEWEVSFLESGATVDFTVVGLDEENRKYFSNTVSNEILAPDDGYAPSLIAQIYKDFLGTSATPEEAEMLWDIAGEAGSSGEVVRAILANVPNTIERVIDILAVQHVVYGQFFDSFSEFEEISNEWLPYMYSDNSEEPLKRFIDSLLSSSKYYETFRGGVPHLVGAPTTNRLINYRENRDSFARKHFSLKYGRSPSTLQLKQASRRMLDYWSNYHEPGYWELLASAPQAANEDAFSGIRRDTNMSKRPDRQGLNGDILPGEFDSGECAVDFIYELAKEFVYPRNQSYLSYTSNYVLRDSLYRPAALLYTLHRENVDTSDKSVIQQARELQGLSTDDVIARITQSSSYQRRLNVIFHEDSPEVTVLPSGTSNNYWKSMPWFGAFMDKEYPWIYHVDLGWMYSNGTDTGDIWFYSDNLKVGSEEIGWFWTNKHVFEGPSMAGSEYDNQRFIFLMRKDADGGQVGSWALLDITTGQATPYGWLPLGK